MESTDDDDSARAMMRLIAPISPPSRNGTASGISAARMSVVDANADTAAPMKQMTRAANSGAPMSATRSPSQSMVPISCMSPT